MHGITVDALAQAVSMEDLAHDRDKRTSSCIPVPATQISSMLTLALRTAENVSKSKHESALKLAHHAVVKRLGS